jgi:hypothetical protein
MVTPTDTTSTVPHLCHTNQTATPTSDAQRSGGGALLQQWRLRRVQERLAQCDARDLIDQYGRAAYEVARQRARQARLGQVAYNRPDGHWDRVQQSIGKPDDCGGEPSPGTFQGNARYGDVNVGPWLNADLRAILRPDELMSPGTNRSGVLFQCRWGGLQERRKETRKAVAGAARSSRYPADLLQLCRGPNCGRE